MCYCVMVVINIKNSVSQDRPDEEEIRSVFWLTEDCEIILQLQAFGPWENSLIKLNPSFFWEDSYFVNKPYIAIYYIIGL